MGACGKLEVPPFPALAGGFFWAWGTSADDVHFEAGSCDLSRYKVAPVSAAARAGGSSAGVTTATVTAGTDVENIELLGNGGAPSVTLTSPSGQVVEPSGSDVRAPAYALRFDRAGRTVVVLNHPEAGVWRIALAPGSVAVRRAEAAGAAAPPHVHAHVRGRRLVYRVDGWTPGTQITFGERAGRVYHELGAANGAVGQLAFTPADGHGGRRSLFAIVAVGGLPRQRIALGSYVAPPPPRPARVRGLRVRRRGASFVVRFAGARGAARYLIDVHARDGRRVEQLTRARTLRLPVRGYADHVRVRVRGVSAMGRNGPAATGRV
jgi:hypothetical protein